MSMTISISISITVTVIYTHHSLYQRLIAIVILIQSYWYG